jgi:two-component system sensor histidine kinase BaeS
VLLICVLAAAAAAGASLLVARQITRPVARLARGLGELTSGSSPAPLVVEGAGELRRLAGSFNDMAEQLRHAREAERSFLLSVSHELKTPITAVRGYAEGLADDAVPVQEAARFIEAESRRLERLVQDLLDLARLDQRTFTVRLSTFDLADTVREVARRYERQAAGDGVDLRIQATPGSTASGDPDRVAQVVSNLTENALRNVPEGGWVRLTTGPGRIEVADSGPGLSTEELPHAFERFYLHSRYRLRRHVGTGLGLAIVRELAEAMGGTVSVESPEGGGTTFTLSLPVSAHD